VTRGQVKELTVLVKADAQGSLESITQAFAALENDEVRVKIVSSGIGDISENDINTAVATGAMVIGFHVSISAAVNQLAKRSGVTFQMYKVIYDLLDDVRGWLSSMLDPEVIETEIGELELLAIFKTTKDRVICGGKVLSGQVDAGSHIVVKRGKETVGEVDLIELQKQQDSAQTVFADEECGMQVTREITPEVGDHFVFVRRETKERTL
jgi:translation initiation factor IF-2